MCAGRLLTAASWLAAILLAGCGAVPAGNGVGDEGGRRAAPASPAARAAEALPAAAAADGLALGPGFVVWESSRGGRWRIWIRSLDGGPARRLTPDERGRSHCCPHISPDGRSVAYLSFATGGPEYPTEGDVGRLHLINADGDGGRVVAPVARSYFENRAVVWRSPDELVYIDGERATRLHNLASGRERRLADPPPEHGWLIDPTLSWATTGLVHFSPYDQRRRQVEPRRVLGGCQPYFSGDGRWGFWMAGNGGPLDAVELGSQRTVRILDKSDRRVPDGLGYAYFPMLSPDGGLWAWAASTGRHDHFRADYEVLIAESDPDSLELIGPPLRVTRNPATDRYPDLWQPPLALGRRDGEAPLTADLSAPEPGDWRWRLGDGATARGRSVRHTWGEAGRWHVVAELGRRRLRGVVVVRPRRPPRALEARALAGGVEVEVRFDEPVSIAAATASLASGRRLTGVEAGARADRLVVRLDEPLTEPDRLVLGGVRDRAEPPNTMPETTLEVAAPSWPARREELVFLWESATAANRVFDRRLGAERAYALTANGAARLDARAAMLVEGGSFVLEATAGAPLVAALIQTNEVTLETVLEPGGGEGPIISQSGRRGVNLRLHQRGGGLVFGIRTGRRGPGSFAQIELFPIPVGRSSHVVVTFAPGRVTAFLDGEPKVDSDAAQGDFFHWRDLPLLFGGGAWRGRIDGVAIYDRALDAAAVRESYKLQRARLGSRLGAPRPAPGRLLDSQRSRRSPATTMLPEGVNDGG